MSTVALILATAMNFLIICFPNENTSGDWYMKCDMVQQFWYFSQLLAYKAWPKSTIVHCDLLLYATTISWNGIPFNDKFSKSTYPFLTCLCHMQQCTSWDFRHRFSVCSSAVLWSYYVTKYLTLDAWCKHRVLTKTLPNILAILLYACLQNLAKVQVPSVWEAAVEVTWLLVWASGQVCEGQSGHCQ